MRNTRVRGAAVLAALASISTLAACGSSSGDTAGSAGKVTITVEGWRPGDQKATIDAVKAQAAAFHKLHPDVTVVPKEWQWNAQTFPAELAGGTLPTTFRVPFTDTKGLVAKHQVADINDLVEALPYAKSFNPSVLAAAKGTDGRIYGIPSDVYAQGLHYNRAMFTAAGLDPNQPPTTWDEVAADAKQIAQKTGQTGYATMSKENQGGWILTTVTYALGGRMETQQGSKYTATVDNAATKQALGLLHKMRWVDNAMGSNTSYDWNSINQAFAAGKVAMYVSGSDVYNALTTTNDINPSDYGLAALPLVGPDSGVLGGGSVNVVTAKATATQAKAAVEWIDFFRVHKYTDKTAAVADAKTQTTAKQPVGTPTFPIFDESSYRQYQSWIKPYVNVPQTQMSSFTDAMFTQQLIAEPPSQTQALYAALDPVVQRVLTDKNANIDALLTSANQQVQQILDKQ